MKNKQSGPLRKADMQTDDNGKSTWRGMYTHKNIQVSSACYPPVQLPGLIIFVHGVNSEGEWYDRAEESLCGGLNARLHLPKALYLIKNSYAVDEAGRRKIAEPECSRSPVIRFYWGYTAKPGTEDEYQIPLRNMAGEDYHALKKYQKIPADQLAKKGPWYWGGGPFQNGCNQLVSLFSHTGFSKWVRGIPIPFSLQFINSERDRLLATAPSRHYFAHAVQRLADLLNTIRNTYPQDTVTVISHSQGTMIAMAATLVADKAPDALFVMNSPYAMDDKKIDWFAYPNAECISSKARAKTFDTVVKKVARQASHLSEANYSRLLVGADADGRSWKPTGMADNNVPERDNHGRTWIYCNPHDRVMGMSALLSIGWQGLPNTAEGKTPELLVENKEHLFQRMLGRETPCGDAPRQDTPFGQLPPAGSSFWDDGGQLGIYSSPPANQSLNINGEKVPKPIDAAMLTDFDKSRVKLQEENKNNTGLEGHGWGQYSAGEKNDQGWNDENFSFYASLYEEKWVGVGSEQGWHPASKDARTNRRKQTREEKEAGLRMFVSQPSDHSSLPSHASFMSQVVAYDLPIGLCESSDDKCFLDELRRMADWQHSDSYFRTGNHPKYTLPTEIDTEIAGRLTPEDIAEIRKMEARNRH